MSPSFSTYYYKIAASLSSGHSMCNLAYMYSSTVMLLISRYLQSEVASEQDFAEAHRLLSIAMKDSDRKVVAHAQYLLALMYNQGTFVKKDVVRALELFELAMEGGNNWAKRHLGELYA